jgi:hypothetical protein
MSSSSPYFRGPPKKPLELAENIKIGQSLPGLGIPTGDVSLEGEMATLRFAHLSDSQVMLELCNFISTNNTPSKTSKAERSDYAVTLPKEELKQMIEYLKEKTINIQPSDPKTSSKLWGVHVAGVHSTISGGYKFEVYDTIPGTSPQGVWITQEDAAAIPGTPLSIKNREQPAQAQVPSRG